MSEALSSIIAELGEGPNYDARTSMLYWFDIVGQKLLALDVATHATSSTNLPLMTSALAVIDETRHLLLTENGLYIRDLESQQLSLLVPLEADNPITRSNDARVHPSGAFWVSTMGKKAEPEVGAIYHYFKGAITKLYGGLTIPNAICFAPDGTRAYFTDTVTAQWMVVDCAPETGLPMAAPRIFYDHRGGEGGLDGAIMDAHGRLINARWGAGCVDIYAPEGALLASIPVPARQPTCPVFFGKDLTRLAVTTAWQGMDKSARAAAPEAGQLFELSLPTLSPPLQGMAEAWVKIA